MEIPTDAPTEMPTDAEVPTEVPTDAEEPTQAPTEQPDTEALTDTEVPTEPITDAEEPADPGNLPQTGMPWVKTVPGLAAVFTIGGMALVMGSRRRDK